MRRIIFFGFALILLSACSKNQDKIDKELIESFVATNSLDAQSTDSGLFYVIDEPGTSEKPTISDEVTVKYRGTFLNGVEFDSNNNISFPLSQVIKGWQEGIPLFGKGGKGMLIIPSDLGYGSNPPQGIPKNSVLVFDIELFDF